MLHCYWQRENVNNKKNTPQSQNLACGLHMPPLGYKWLLLQNRAQDGAVPHCRKQYCIRSAFAISPSSLCGCTSTMPETSQQVNSSLCNACLQLYHFTTEINTTLKIDLKESSMFLMQILHHSVQQAAKRNTGKEFSVLEDRANRRCCSLRHSLLFQTV